MVRRTVKGYRRPSIFKTLEEYCALFNTGFPSFLCVSVCVVNAHVCTNAHVFACREARGGFYHFPYYPFEAASLPGPGGIGLFVCVFARLAASKPKHSPCLYSHTTRLSPRARTQFVMWVQGSELSEH